MNIDILAGSPALSDALCSAGDTSHRSQGCKIRWMDPATRHWPQSIRNWWRLREVLSISRPSGEQGEVPPPGERGLTPLSDSLHLALLKTLGRGEECDKHQQ